MRHDDSLDVPLSNEANVDMHECQSSASRRHGPLARHMV